MSDKKASEGPKETRRGFVKKAAYVAPTVVSYAAVASLASAGSGYVYTEGMMVRTEMTGGMMGGMMG